MENQHWLVVVCLTLLNYVDERHLKLHKKVAHEEFDSLMGFLRPL